jgi:hypothetical protein
MRTANREAVTDVGASGVTSEPQVPAGVDEARVRRMRVAARALDDLVRVPGTKRRFGLDPVLGVLPVAGNVVATGLALYVVYAAARLGVSYGTFVRMLANVAVDFAGGLVPYVGVFVDAYWKANRRNIDLAVADLETGPSNTVFAARAGDR